MDLFGKKKKRILAEGTQAQAVLVGVQDTGVTVNMNPRVKLTLRVQPNGGQPFEVVKTQTVSRVAIPQPGTTYIVRYDPSDPKDVEFDQAAMEQYNQAAAQSAPAQAAGGGAQTLDSESAGSIAAAVQAAGAGTVQRSSAAELLASGQRMTAVLREFSPSGSTVGDANPSAPDPSDPVYVMKTELEVDGSNPIEAVFMHRVPQAKVASLRLGAHLNVAVNPANPTREVAIDWATSPVAA